MEELCEYCGDQNILYIMCYSLCKNGYLNEYFQLPPLKVDNANEAFL